MDSNQKTIQAFNKFAEQYADFTFTNLLQYELNRFIALIPKNSSILDVACGSGRDTQYFLDYNLKPIGIDASEKLIKEAKKRVPKGKFQKMDMRYLKFSQQSFNGIWALDAISYIQKDIPDVLNQFNRILKPEGILFISVRKGTGEKQIKLEKIGKEEVTVSFFKQTELESLLKKTNFEILNSYTEEGKHFTWINIFAKKK